MDLNFYQAHLSSLQENMDFIIRPVAQISPKAMAKLNAVYKQFRQYLI